MKQYKARIYFLAANGSYTEATYPVSLRANYFIIKRGIIDKIELPRKSINFSLVDDNNIFHFIETPQASGPPVFKQIPQQFMIDTEEMKKFMPIGTDVIQHALHAIDKCRSTLTPKSLLKAILPYVGMLLLVIMFIVSFAMLQNSC